LKCFHYAIAVLAVPFGLSFLFDSEVVIEVDLYNEGSNFGVVSFVFVS